MLSISPRLILEWFLKDIYKIVVMLIFFGIASVFFALSIPNKYVSNSLVSSNLNNSKSSISQLGGLASLAGISLGGEGLSPRVLHEMINSKSFLVSFIREYDLEKDIIATKSYDVEGNKFIYDEKIFDVNTNKWVREFNYPQKLEPSDAELALAFKEHFSASYEIKVKLIKLSYKSLSPEYSKKILQDLVYFFNEYLREFDISTSEMSISYLKKQLSLSKYGEVKLALQQIMEEQYKKLALAKTRKEYALRIIESPMIASQKSEPKRAVICVLVTFIGTFLSVLLMWSFRVYRLS
jgi:uncharacterized protein involved in exopolysaccharide biosynthesis